eukprot:snap_masked-scaffold_26-processed-gene-4.99-mRNA-1 protein AED:1.00 eAED:1.00 QI:0/-1/0/0/-1/1/1/0/144
MAQRFIEAGRFSLFEMDLEKTAELYKSLLQIGIGFQFCRKISVLRHNYILFMRTGLGLANNRFASMERVKSFLMNYLDTAADGSLHLHVDSDEDNRRPQDIRRSVESSAVVEENVVVNTVNVDLRLQNTDIMDFLSDRFEPNYG